MKNVTVRVDEAVVEAARSRARDEGTTLNEKVRSWLADYARQGNRGARYDQVMARLRRRGSVDRKYTREEMNER
jgi:hypothetical protein